MQCFLLLIIFGLFCMLGNLQARGVNEDELKDESTTPLSPVEVTDFEYSSANEPRRYTKRRYQQKSNPPTTTRPFVSYWQNFVRNVRVPVPSITWNVTNPLANLFQISNEQDVVDDDYYTSSSQRHNKNKKHRKQQHHNHKSHKKHRKNKHPHEHSALLQEYDMDYSAQQTLLQQYPPPTINNNLDTAPMYFYDPQTDAYYAVQRVRAFGSFVQSMPSFNKKFTTNEKEINEIPQPINGFSNEDSFDADDDDDDINLDEAEEIDLDQMAKTETEAAEAENENGINANEKTQNSFLHEESLRNVLGTFMRDDYQNQQRQRSMERKGFNTYKKIKPRKQQNYYYLFGVN